MEIKKPVKHRARRPKATANPAGAYAWSQGDVGGVVWKDLPLVDVDEEGKELP